MRRTVFRIGLNIPPVIKSRFKGRSFVEVNQPTSRYYGRLTHVPFDDNKVQERRAITIRCPLQKLEPRFITSCTPVPPARHPTLSEISCTTLIPVHPGGPMSRKFGLVIRGEGAQKNPLIIQGVQRELQRPQLMYAPLSFNQFAPKTIEGGPPCCYTKKKKCNLKDRSARPSQIL